MTLPLKLVVNVSDQIEVAGVLYRDFGIGLFITTDANLGSGQNRVMTVADLNTVAQAFPDTSEPYKAADAWFSQSPYPKNLILGRWFKDATSAKLVGGKVTTTVSTFAGLTNTCYVNVSVDGTTHEVNVDLTSVSDYASVASAVQNALTGAGADATVNFDATKTAFVVQSNTTGASSLLSAFSTPSTGTDLGPYLMLDSADIQSLNQGVNSESIIEAIQAIKAINNSYYFVMLGNNAADDTTILTLADYIETQKLMFSSQSVNVDILTVGETSSVAYQLYTKQYERTWMTYSSTADYKAVSISARMSSVNFDSPNSVITPKFKQLPGLTPDTFSQDNIQELERKRVNYYTDFSTQPIYSEGYCFNNSVYIDVRYALDWFDNNVQVNVYDLLIGSGKLPQTDQGEAQIVNEIMQSCQQAVNNGMVAAGTVSDAMKADIILSTKNNNFNGQLTRGYLVWSQPTAQQSQADRDARKATAKKVWLKGSGAIHSVDIAVTFEN